MNWTIRLGHQAEDDFLSIVQWTMKTFGQQQAGIYAETISLAIEALTAGPNIAGVRMREDIQPDIWTLHVARQGRAGRHFVVFRTIGSDIDVLRLLHDSMDLPRHLPQSKPQSLGAAFNLMSSMPDNFTQSGRDDELPQKREDF